MGDEELLLDDDPEFFGDEADDTWFNDDTKPGASTGKKAQAPRKMGADEENDELEDDELYGDLDDGLPMDDDLDIPFNDE